MEKDFSSLPPPQSCGRVQNSKGSLWTGGITREGQASAKPIDNFMFCKTGCFKFLHIIRMGHAKNPIALFSMFMYIRPSKINYLFPLTRPTLFLAIHNITSMMTLQSVIGPRCKHDIVKDKTLGSNCTCYVFQFPGRTLIKAKQKIHYEYPWIRLLRTWAPIYCQFYERNIIFC